MAEPEKLVLSEAMAHAVNTAYETSKPMIVAYTDDDGLPHLSFRGTAQAFGPDQLAIWVREPAGGILANIEKHPLLSLLYRDGPNRVTYIFYGRGRVVEDEATRRTVFENSNEKEQVKDPERKGKPIIIDLDTVQASEGDRRFLMKR
jgi:hypothetical protein